MYRRALAVAIVEGNKEREATIFDSYKARLGQDLDKCAQWEAEHLYYRYLFAKEDVIERLKELATRHPSNWAIKGYIGHVYMKYRQYGTASTYFTEAAKIADDRSERLTNLCEAAIALAKDGNVVGMEESLSLARCETTAMREGAEIMLRYMANVTTETNEADLHLACSEALLNINPSDHDCRFGLAFKYSELGLNELSLYHYRILADQKPTDAIWHNIGVAAGHLNMPIRSVIAYRESEKLGGTLALNNLAHKLLDAGFVVEADQICQKAMTVPNYDKQVGTAISRVKDDPKAEEDKEKDILEKTSKKSFLCQILLWPVSDPDPPRCTKVRGDHRRGTFGL